MKQSEKSNRILTTTEQTNNTSRRKMLSAGMGAAASASLGGIGLLVPSAAQALNVKSCWEVWSAWNNFPKGLTVIHKTEGLVAASDCTNVRYTRKNDVVLWDKKRRRAIYGVQTEIVRKPGITSTEYVYNWEEKSSATLLKVNNSWTSNFYDENRNLLIRARRDQLLNPLTCNKPWSNKDDSYRRRLDEDPQDPRSPTEIRADLHQAMKELFVEYMNKALSDRKFRFDRGPKDYNWSGTGDLVVEVMEVGQTLGNEPSSTIMGIIRTARRAYYRIHMVRDFRNPFEIYYQVLVVPTEEIGDGTGGYRDMAVSDAWRIQVEYMDSTEWASRLYNVFTREVGRMIAGTARTLIAERAAVLAGNMLATRLHYNIPEGVYNRNYYLPFALCNALVADVDDFDDSILHFDLITSTLIIQFYRGMQLGFPRLFIETAESIVRETAIGVPWYSFRYQDEIGADRRLIGYTQDRNPELLRKVGFLFGPGIRAEYRYGDEYLPAERLPGQELFGPTLAVRFYEIMGSKRVYTGFNVFTLTDTKGPVVRLVSPGRESVINVRSTSNGKVTLIYANNE